MGHPLRILELHLEITKLAMEDQEPDVKAKLWKRHLDHMEKTAAFWDKLADAGDEVTP